MMKLGWAVLVPAAAIAACSADDGRLTAPRHLLVADAAQRAAVSTELDDAVDRILPALPVTQSARVAPSLQDARGAVHADDADALMRALDALDLTLRTGREGNAAGADVDAIQLAANDARRLIQPTTGK